MDGNLDFEQEPTFRDLVSVVRRGFVLALAVSVAAAVLTYFLTKRIPPTYQATATVLASQPDSALRQFGVSLVTAPTVAVTAYEAAATSNPVVVAAMQSLGLQNPSEKQVEDLLKNVTVRADTSQQSSLIHIDVMSRHPQTSATTANALANSLLTWDKQRATQNLQKIVEALQGQLTSLDAQITQLKSSTNPDTGQISGLQSLRAQQGLQLNSARALENSAVGNLEILEPAIVPLASIEPRPGRDAALAFVLGIFVVYGLLLLRELVDTRFKGTDDLARILGHPVLAEFPRVAGGSRHLPHEAANYLRTNVLFATTKDQPKLLLVTSVGSGDGKTSVAISLAESFARNDYRTLLIDADLRKPRVGAEYGLSPEESPPLQALLEHPTRAPEPVTVALGHAVLHVIPSFVPSSSPTELLAAGFSKVIQRCADDFDVIVVDSAPVLPVADALTIAPHCTGVVFPVSLPTTDRRSTQAALAILERIGVRVLGVVVTNLSLPGNRRGRYGYGQGYGHGYGYGYGPIPSAEASAHQDQVGEVSTEDGRAHAVSRGSRVASSED